MKAQISQLPIDKVEKSTSSSSTLNVIKNHRKTMFFYYCILILNLVSFMDQGALIARCTIYNDINNYNYSIMCALSVFGNVVFSCISIRLIHKLFKKLYFLIFNLIMIIFLALMIFMNNDLYIHFISKFIIGFCQTVISIYSVQWCIFFSHERERLDMIDKLQFTPMLGILIGFLIQINIKNDLKLSIILEASFMLLFLIIFFITPGKRLENKTISLTDEFLRNSINKIDSYSEIKGHFGVVFLILGMIFFQMFIFGVLLFVFYNQEVVPANNRGENVELMIVFAFVGFIAPFLGVIFGALFTFWFKHVVLVVINLFFHLILIGVIGGGIYIEHKNFLNYKTSLMMKGVFYSLIGFFNSTLSPFLYGFVANYLTYKEDRIFMYKAEMFVSNLGLLLGAILTTFLINFLKITNITYIIAGLAAISFVFFAFFGLASVIRKLSRKTGNEIRLFEYQIFLLFGNLFGKYVLFIWDDCNGEGLIENRAESFHGKLFDDNEENDEEKNKEDRNVEEPKTEIIQGRDSKMTFNNYQGTLSHDKSNPNRGETGSNTMFSFNGNGGRGPLTNTTDPNELFEKKRDS